MLVGIRDGIKLVGISIVAFCAVFVCAFFLNFYVDVQTVENAVTEQMRPLYEAQLATARFTCAITGGFLAVVAAVMLAFYIKLYVDGNGERIGILKALGYSDGRLALGFWVFGLSVLIGATAGLCVGYASMPAIYKQLTIDGLPNVPVRFNAWLPIALVIAPTALLTASACLYAYFYVRKPVMRLLRGRTDITKKSDKHKKSSRTISKDGRFLLQMCFAVLRSKKASVFFVAFSCFCFSAMVQMGASMYDMDSGTMGLMILLIGVTLAAVSMIMAVTTVVNGNAASIALMRAFGYSDGQCALSVLGGYTPFALIGFIVGTAYQYGLLRIMVDLLFADVAEMPAYSYDVALTFIVFAVFAAAYAAVMGVYAVRLKRISIKAIMLEN